MFEFWLGALQLHAPGLVNFELKNPIEGLESPAYRITNYDRPGEDGSVVSSAHYGMRQVTLTGRVFGSSPAQLEQNRLALSTACAIQRDDNGYPVLTRCLVTTTAGTPYYFHAQVGQPKFNYGDISWADFMIPLLIPDPQIYSTDGVQSGAIPLPTSTGITWPVTWPVTFGGLTGGSLEVDNPGNIFSWPLITLTGPLTNPYLLNTTTGKLLQLNYVLDSDDVVQIFMGDLVDATGVRQPGKRIMKNGTDNLIAAKTSDSDWWALEPGPNLISFSSGNTADTGTMSLQYYPAVVGI